MPLVDTVSYDLAWLRRRDGMCAFVAIPLG